MYAGVSICMYICMYVWMCVCMYACMHVCMYVCVYVCVYVCTYVCVCVRATEVRGTPPIVQVLELMRWWCTKTARQKLRRHNTRCLGPQQQLPTQMTGSCGLSRLDNANWLGSWLGLADELGTTDRAIDVHFCLCFISFCTMSINHNFLMARMGRKWWWWWWRWWRQWHHRRSARGTNCHLKDDLRANWCIVLICTGAWRMYNSTNGNTKASSSTASGASSRFVQNRCKF